MNAKKRVSLASVLATGMIVLPLVSAGSAGAVEDETTGYPSTQSPLQALAAVQATIGNAMYSLTDGINGADRPDGADGDKSELPGLDPRLVEGPLGGLLVDGPLE